MALHFPSILAGTALSGVTFAAVHQQMSHRNRLSHRWPVAEWAEQQIREQWKVLKSEVSSNSKAQLAAQEVSSASKYWNQGVTAVQDLFERKQ